MPAITLQCLLQIEPYGTNEVYRYQNYQLEDLFFESQSFEYGNFQFQAYPQQQLELADDSAEIWVRNTELIRTMLRQYDGLRRAHIRAIHIQPDTGLPPWEWNLQVFDTVPERGYVRFNLRSPTSALVGPLVSRYFNSAEFPELPLYRVQL